MRLSIIVPIYNVEKYIRRCLNELVKQMRELEDVELILVDDGSSDNSGNICDYYSNNYERVRSFHQKNLGVASSRNFGIKKANGKYIYFVDSDDFIEDKAIFNIMKCLKFNVDLLVFSYYTIDNFGRKSERLLDDLFLDKEKFRKKFITLFKTDMFYTVWNKVYKKNFLMKNKIFFPSITIGEDTRFNINVYKHLKNSLISSKKIYNYVSNRENSSMTSYNNDRFQLQCEEVKQIGNLLNDFGINDIKFLNKLYKDIIVGCIYNISESKLDLRKKYILVDSIFKSYTYIKTRSLVRKNNFSDYLIFNEKIYWLIIFLETKRRLKSILKKLNYNFG